MFKYKDIDNTKINVLGAEYKILFKNGQGEDKGLEGRSGYIDFYAKKIVIDSIEWTANEKHKIENEEEYIKECLRHEIIHAFLFESGLSHSSNESNKWAVNEEMIDWLAIQFNKIKKVFKELKI